MFGKPVHTRQQMRLVSYFLSVVFDGRQEVDPGYPSRGKDLEVGVPMMHNASRHEDQI